MAFPGTASVARDNGVYQVTLRESYHGRDVNRYLFRTASLSTILWRAKRALSKCF